LKPVHFPPFIETKGLAVNHIASRLTVILSLLVVPGLSLNGQGFTWESTTTSAIEGMKEIHSTASYRPHMFKQSSATKATIVRLDKEVLLSIDNDRKEYSEMTFTELEAKVKAAGGELNSKMAEMKKKLDSMPPDQRKMVEQMMGDKLNGAGQDPKVEVVNSGEKKTISGYSCTKYIIKADGKEFSTVWTTTGIPEFGTMKDDFMAFTQRMASLSPLYGKQISVGMKSIDGFPIETTIASITATVTKISRQTVPASEFEVPSGYTKVKPHDRKMKTGEDAGEKK
jgi:hypothetical protein